MTNTQKDEPKEITELVEILDSLTDDDLAMLDDPNTTFEEILRKDYLASQEDRRVVA